MFERLRYFNYRQYLQRENIGLIIAALFGLWVAWNTFSIVVKNNQLQNQIVELRENVALLELENRNLELSITYYQTDEYLELAAREDLLLRAPGENVAIAPKTRDAPYELFPEAQQENQEDKSNFQQWIDFLAGRS